MIAPTHSSSVKSLISFLTPVATMCTSAHLQYSSRHRTALITIKFSYNDVFRLNYGA